MTTAHRPTFDHAKGKANNKRSTIQHKRSLPAHKQLKYRKRRPSIDADFDNLSQNDSKRYHPEVTKKSVRELKRELLIAEGKELPADGDENVDGDGDGDEDESRAALEDRRQRLLVEMKEIDESSSSSLADEGETDDEKEGGDYFDEQGSEGTEGSNSSSEDEDDEEAELLKELEKIRKEKELKKQKEEEIESSKRAANSNPLLQYDDEDDEDDEEGTSSTRSIKRSWRSQAIFSHSNTKSQGEGKNQVDVEFVNDMLKSDFHRKFMDRHVK